MRPRQRVTHYPAWAEDLAAAILALLLLALLFAYATLFYVGLGLDHVGGGARSMTTEGCTLTPALLAELAAYIVKRGWCQGINQEVKRHADGRVTECHCLTHAIAMAAPHVGDYPPPFSADCPTCENAVIAVHTELRRQVSPQLIAWNDAPARRQDEVVAALEAAAKELAR